MNYRNPKHNAHGGIDLEFDHPTYGWIPCSTHPDDATTAELYAQALASGNVAERDLIANPRIGQIKIELAMIDSKKIRPMSEGDTAYLATLNAQTKALRDELATLPLMV